MNTLINYQYYISDSKTEQVSKFKNVGIIFDTKIHISVHTNMIKNKTIRNVGFIKLTRGFF